MTDTAISLGRSRPQKTERPSPPAHALAYTLEDAARVSGLSQPTLRRRAAEGRLTLVKVGGRTLVHADSLKRLLGLEAASS
jgi:excisionase family DNA binding protein